jgi:peptidoglycan biosynthesis protein MviN/MurJ (putative lipid II flippase)
MGLIIVLAPAFYAFKDFKTPTRAAFLALGLNFFLNSLFVFGLGLQALSVTLATSISSWINVVYLYNKLHQHFGKVMTKEGIFEINKVILISIVCAAVTFLFESSLFITPTFFHFFSDLQDKLPSTIIDQVITLAVPGLFYLALIVSLAWIFRAKDLLVLFRLRGIR